MKTKDLKILVVRDSFPTSFLPIKYAKSTFAPLYKAREFQGKRMKNSLWRFEVACSFWPRCFLRFYYQWRGCLTLGSIKLNFITLICTTIFTSRYLQVVFTISYNLRNHFTSFIYILVYFLIIFRVISPSMTSEISVKIYLLSN